MATVNIQDLPPLTLKKYTAANNLLEVVEISQFNFDQVLLHGGGRVGKTGKPGDKGLPGATGLGRPGDPGRRGSWIFFDPGVITNGTVVTDVTQISEDVVIDANGSYFQIIENTSTGDLEYIYQFNINTSSLNAYVVSQTDYATSGSNPVDQWIIKDGGGSLTDMNLLLAKRSPRNGSNDKSEFYRMGLGVDAYVTQNATQILCNILPLTGTPAINDFYAQLGFKFRANDTSNISANTGWVIYKEDPSTSQYQFSFENASTGLWLVHNTANSSNSRVVVRGSLVQFIGTNSNINNVSATGELLQMTIVPNMVYIASAKDMTVRSNDFSGTAAIYFEFPFFNSTGKTVKFTASIDTTLEQNNLILDSYSSTLLTINSLVNVNILDVGKLWTWTVNSKFDGKFAMAVGAITADGSGILDLNDTASGDNANVIDITPFSLQGVINNIINGIENQVITIRNSGSSYIFDHLFIDHNSNIQLTRRDKMVLHTGESITLQLRGSIWYQIGSSLMEAERIRYVVNADISSDFDNLTQPGFYRLHDLGVTANYGVPGGATSSYPLYTKVEGLEGLQVIQTQTDMYYSQDDMDVWKRKYYYNATSTTYVWSPWFQEAYTNKSQRFTAQQRFSQSATLDAVTTNTIISNRWWPHAGGNSYSYSGTATIARIKDLGDGAVIKIRATNASGFILQVAQSDNSGYLGIEYNGNGLYEILVSTNNFLVKQGHTISLTQTSGKWMITDYCDALSVQVANNWSDIITLGDDLSALEATVTAALDDWITFVPTNLQFTAGVGTVTGINTGTYIKHKKIGKAMFVKAHLILDTSGTSWGTIGFDCALLGMTAATEATYFTAFFVNNGVTMGMASITASGDINIVQPGTWTAGATSVIISFEFFVALN